MSTKGSHFLWEGHVDHLITTFKHFHAEKDLADVSLVCEDGRQLSAHKLVLSACSLCYNTNQL